MNCINKSIIALCIIFHLILPIFQSHALDLSQKLDKTCDLIETGKPDSAIVLLHDLLDLIVDKNERVRALYYLSQAMSQLGRLSKEIQYLIMAREESPEAQFADKVNLAYSRILLNTGNYDDCIGITNEFRKLHIDSPLLPEMLYIAGEANYLKGEYRRAFNIFNEITENYKDYDVAVESIMKEGMCLFRLELIGGAIERFEHFLSQKQNGKNIPEALYFLGVCYENIHQPELVIEVYKRIIIDYPFYPKFMEIHFKLGKNFFDTGRFAEAKNAFSNYIANTDKASIEHNEALLYLERISLKKRTYYSEIDMYENFITKYPESTFTPKILFKLAEYYKTTGKYDDTFEKYKILMTNTLYSNYADSSAFLMADTYFSIDKQSEAITLIKSLAFQKPDSLRTQKYLLKIGSLYEKGGFYDEAISWYNSSIILQYSSDLSVEALLGIGRVFKKLDRWMESGKSYERIIEEYPDNPYMKEVYLALSDIYFLEGRHKDAVLKAEQAVKYADDKEKIDILLYIADLYGEIDEYHALELYSIIFNNKRNSSSQITEALLKYGDLALRTGDSASAVNAFATVITNGTDSLSVRKAREKLNRINETEKK